jgi:hypothetical protein
MSGKSAIHNHDPKRVIITEAAHEQTAERGLRPRAPAKRRIMWEV